MRTDPRIISELQRVTCVTCGLSFAVPKDYVIAQMSVSRTVMVCPNGHTTPFTTRLVDTASLVADLSRRIDQLEHEFAARHMDLPPLPEAKVRYQAPPRPRSEPAVEVGEPVEEPVKEREPNAWRPGARQCPYCEGWYSRAREHARRKHKDQYKMTDFPRGVE